MATLVTVANEVLDMIAYPSYIDSLDENSDAPRSVKRHIYSAIKTVLNEYNWQESIKTVKIPQQSYDSEKGESAYARPGDCIRVLKPKPEYYVIEQNLLLVKTDAAEMEIQYLFNNTNPQSWSVSFTDCLKLKLASDLARALLKNHNLSRDFWKEYKSDALPLARSRQMLERKGKRKIQRSSSYIRAREFTGYVNPEYTKEETSE